MERFDGGNTKQFTVSMSVSPDGLPKWSLYTSDGTVVCSLGTSTQSGSTYDYYYLYTLPASVGMYLGEWSISVGSKAYLKKEMFEIVLTDADQSGLYSNPNDLRNLYSKIDTTGLTNREINEFIADQDAYINMKLSKAYSVPFATGVDSLPPMIHYLSKNLALLEILSRPSMKQGGDTPGWIVDRREHFESILDGLGAGSYSLTTSGGTLLGADPAASVLWSDTMDGDDHPIFTLLDSEDQQIDADVYDSLKDDLDSDATS